MASTFPIPLTTLPAGARTFGPAAIPDADTQITLDIDRTVAGGLNSLTSASVLTIEAQMSADGGATWHAADTAAPGTTTQASAAGGLVTWTDFRTGQPRTLTDFTGTWTLFPGAGRRVRAVITVSGPSSIAVAGSIVTQ